MNKLGRKFVILNMIIISSIAVLIAVLFYFISSASQMTFTRSLGIIALMLTPIWLGSFLSAKIAMKPIQVSWQHQLDFTADASHELRTPLAVIQSNLELVMDNPDETVGSQIKWLNNIHIETVRMARLVNDLLTLSRSDSGSKTLEYSRFSLNSAAAEAAAIFETVAGQKGITIQVMADSEISFWGDYLRIKQLLAILLDNAVKYSDKPGRIQIILVKKDSSIELAVWDTGVGIASEHLSKIFNRFYRAAYNNVSRAENDNQTTDGFGLGLSIAEWIVKEHGGSIKAEGAPNKGTRFTAVFQHK